MTDSGPADAPWFYRRRFMVFAILYAVAFFAGFMIMGVARVPAVPIFRYSFNPNFTLVLAFVLVLGGFAMRIWASSFFAPDVVSAHNPQARQLNVSGPYRFTRNPLYLGNLFQAAGLALATPWLVAAMILAGNLALTYALIFVEEPFLTKTLGVQYTVYRERVGRLFPLPWKVAPPGGQPGSLREGLQTELTIGLIAVVMFAIALINDAWLPYPGQ